MSIPTSSKSPKFSRSEKRKRLDSSYRAASCTTLQVWLRTPFQLSSANGIRYGPQRVDFCVGVSEIHGVTYHHLAQLWSAVTSFASRISVIAFPEWRITGACWIELRQNRCTHFPFSFLFFAIIVISFRFDDTPFKKPEPLPQWKSTLLFLKVCAEKFSASHTYPVMLRCKKEEKSAIFNIHFCLNICKTPKIYCFLLCFTKWLSCPHTFGFTSICFVGFNVYNIRQSSSAVEL